jgi:hypothetical protein
MKNEKLSGYDNLDADLFKADPGKAAIILLSLFTAVWEEEKVSDDWCKGGGGCNCQDPKERYIERLQQLEGNHSVIFHHLIKYL